MQTQKLIRLTALTALVIAAFLVSMSFVSAQMPAKDENTDLWRVRGMAQPSGLPPSGLWRADSLYIGATFLRDTTKPFIVWLYDHGSASYQGALYLMLPPSPGKPDTTYFLFKNKCNTTPERIDLTPVASTIHHLDTLFFMYKSTLDGGCGTTNKLAKDTEMLFTGPNRAPGEGWQHIDRHYSSRQDTTTFFSLDQQKRVPFGRRWCEAGWIHTQTNGTVRTDTVEFGFEDQLHGSDMYYEDIKFDVTGVFLIHSLTLDTLMLSFFPVRDTVGIGDSISFHTVIIGTDSLGKQFQDSTNLAKNITWQLKKPVSSQSSMTLGNGPSNTNTFKAVTGGEKDTIIVSYTDPKSGATLQTRQVIFVKANAPPITNMDVTATVLDTNKNGHIDRIDLTWNTSDTIKTPMPSVSDLIKSLTLVTLDGNRIVLQPSNIVYDKNGKTIHIIVTETTGSIYETGVNTGSSQFILTNLPMTTGGRPFFISAIVDGAAPVIKAVCFVPAGKFDTLRVTFSEPVNSTNKPGDPKNDYFSFVNTLNNTNHSSSEFLNSVINQSDRFLYLYESSKILTNALLV